MDGGTLDVVDWMLGRGSKDFALGVSLCVGRSGEQGEQEYRARCRKWSDSEGLGLSWLLVLLPVVIVVFLFILFSELR